jgi:hypothetical protein
VNNFSRIIFITNRKEEILRELKEDHNAPFALFYGDTNSGKTTSIIRSAPGPILFISVEQDALKSVAVCKALNEAIDIKVVCPESHEDLMAYLNKIALTLMKEPARFKYNTLVFDSGTFWMNCKLAIRVEDDRNKGRNDKDKGRLSAMTKTDWTEVNTVNSQMARLTDLLKEIAGLGVFTIMTAQMQEDPKWNRDLEAAPCFNYKDFNKALKGYFDYIGFTIPRTKRVDPEDEDSEVETVYPPLLSFNGQHGYLVKWRGVQPKKLTGTFDLSKIFSWYVKRKGGSEDK